MDSTAKSMEKKESEVVSSGTTTVSGSYIRLKKDGSIHNPSSSYHFTDYLTGIQNAESEQGVMYDVAAGNFDGNDKGKSAQIAMVYAKDYSNEGGLYLRFGDAQAGTSGSYGDSIELLAPGKKIGNPDLEHEGVHADNFAEKPCQLKNYLQTATGDWNGDGTDEVAVYIPEKGNSKIVVYAYQGALNEETAAYKNPSYEAIAEDYSVLPQISDTVLRHEIGDPSTYLSSTSGYQTIAQYNGDPASVGFTSKGGGDTISQEIAMSSSNSTSYTAATSVECKIGAGAGGVKAGAILGSENGAGKVTITTSGSSFSGELQAMPAEAEAYGYGMNWKIFCYKYSDSNMSFPVVSYLVSDVKQPAPLPEDFEQDVAKTTDDSVTLRWSYDKFVSGFQLYRYYEFPDGSGSYRLQYVPFAKGKRNGNTGRYEFEYTDTGLSPYTEYQYQIQTESTTKPTVSIYSEPIICRTKTTLGYPDMEVSGLNDDGKLAIYPDAQGEAKVTVKNPENYKEIAYQWQKLTDGSWVDLPAYKTDTLKIANASAADKGTYRCRVNVIYFDTTSQKEYYISAYTDELETAYTKRTPAGTLTVNSQVYGNNQDVNGIHAQVEMHSVNINNMTAPLGTVTFQVAGKDYEYSKTVDLSQNSGTRDFKMGTGTDGNEIIETKYYSTATMDVTNLPEGAYMVTYYYSGDKNFKDETQETGKMVVIGNGTGYTLHLTDGTNTRTRFQYGGSIVPKLYSASAGSTELIEVNEIVL